MKQMMLGIVTTVGVLVAQQINYGEYSNSKLENLSFTDSISCNKIYSNRGVASGTQGPANGTDSLKDSGSVTLAYVYSYDSISNSVTMEGAGQDLRFDLDSQKRVTKITLGNIRTTFLTYKDNQVTIADYPNDTAMTRHTCKWDMWYRPDGQIEKVIRTPADWTYLGPYFWAENNADTVIHTYDSENRKIGTSKILWSADLFHAYPWIRGRDSLEYSYGDNNGKKSVVVQSLSPIGDSWGFNALDTQWTALFNEKGQLIQQTTRRRDVSSQMWDTLYYTVSNYIWEDSLLIERHDILHYGTGSSTMAVLDERYFYGPNPLVVKGATSIAQKSLSVSNMRFTQMGESLELTGGSVDKLVLVSLSGRVLREISGSARISLEGISRNQVVIALGYSRGVQVVLKKITVQ